MWKRIVGSTAEMVAGDQCDPLCGVQPILHAMRWFGLELNLSLERSSFHRWAAGVWAVISFALMELAVIHDVYFMPDMYTIGGNSTSLKSTRLWLNLVLRFKWVTWDALFPLVMFVAVVLKWPQLWPKTVKVLNSNLVSYDSDLHWRLRRFTMTSTVVFIAVVS